MNRREFVKGSLALAGAAAFFNVGCAKESADGKETSKEGTRKMDKKCMVIYYSWSGNTRFAAETIAKKAGAPTFEIKAETPYNSNFNKCCDEAKPECYGKTLRPIKAIEGLDLAKYDVVFVGSPNWWGTLAPCLFQTHGGGGMQRVGKEFAEIFGDTATVLSPKAFSGSSIKSSVKALEDFADERIAGK